MEISDKVLVSRRPSTYYVRIFDHYADGSEMTEQNAESTEANHTCWMTQDLTSQTITKEDGHRRVPESSGRSQIFSLLLIPSEAHEIVRAVKSASTPPHVRYTDV